MRWFLYSMGLVLLLWTVASAVTMVQPGERAVVRRFGRILDDKPGPGLFLGLPWGFDQVERVALNRDRLVLAGWTGTESAEDAAVVPPGQNLTGDHNLVNVKAEIYYSVRPDEVDKFVVQADRVELLIARAAEALLGEWISGRSIDEVLHVGANELPRYLQRHLPDRLAAAGLGVEIQRASIAELNAPEEVREDFDRIAQAQMTASMQINQARQEANRKRREADTEAGRIHNDAMAYTAEQRLQAEAEAASFLGRLEKYRHLTARDPQALNSIWQDEMTRLYARMREGGRIDLLDHFLTGEGLSITQFPLLPKKK